MTWLIFYPTSDTEHCQLMILYEFFIKITTESVLCGLFLSVLRSEYLRFPGWGWLLCLKMLSIRQKNSSILYSYIHFLISCYLPCYWQSKLAHVINKTVLFYTTVLFYLLSNPYISNISSIYNTDQNLSLASQTICDHMFSYPKLDHAFHIFQLRSWIIFPYPMCLFPTYFEGGKVLESTVSWFLI